MLSIFRLLSPAITLAIAFLLWKAIQFLWSYRSPLRHLQGPQGTSLVLGNLDIVFDYNSEVIEKWVKEYGATFRFKGFFNHDQLFTLDARAISHILNHTNDYQKPLSGRQGLAELFGEGLLLSEGPRHHQQRRIMNPAFGPAQIRELTDTFFAKANYLRELWSSEIANDPTATVNGTRIDVMPWMNKVTLDIIGLTGFNYNFDSLNFGRMKELGQAFSLLFKATQNLNVTDLILRAMLPFLRLIPSVRVHNIQAAQQTMTDIGQELLKNAKADALASNMGKETIEKGNLRGRDLLSLLVKANMATDIPESQQVSDKDVIAQVPTFLVAGHETTSTAAAWALYAITQAPDVQMKLREELLSVDTDTPSMDELMALPYLDMVVKETLRLHAPIPGIPRMATKNDIIPVDKPYVDRHGVVRNTITIAKGDEIMIPILTMNRSKEIWGPDAHEFNPERWSDLPKTTSRVPGVWGHMMTFLSGPRACIGYRFSLVEFKVILFTLVRAFEFKLAVPVSEVAIRTAIVQRPILRSDSTQRSQLPMLVKPLERM